MKLHRSSLPLFSLFLIMQTFPAQANYNHLPDTNQCISTLRFINAKDAGRFSLTNEFLATIATVFKAKTFVETGTYLGNTTERASNFFSTVYSIEVSPQLYSNAMNRFRNSNNVILFLGDSSEMLSEIISKLTNKSVFFLDGHYSDETTGKGKIDNPIIKEIDQINKDFSNNAIIIIDDTRLYYPPIGQNDSSDLEAVYPSLPMIVSHISKNNIYKFILLHDSLIAYPSHDEIFVSPVARACTMSRLYDGTNFEIADLMKEELIIAQAKGEELNTIINLSEHYTDPGCKSNGTSRHYPLWHGLTLMEAGKYEKAYEKFQEAYERGLTHPRVNLYKSCARARTDLKHI